MPSAELNKLRKLGVPRASVAKILGVHESTLSRWEAGLTAPSATEASLLKSLLAIAENARTNSTAKETLAGIVSLGSGGAPGLNWIGRWGGLLAIGGLIGVVGAALAESLVQGDTAKAKRKSK